MAWHSKERKRPVADANKNDSPTYTAGQEIEVSEQTAQHFINRGVAEKVVARSQAREVQKPADKSAEEAKPVGR